MSRILDKTAAKFAGLIADLSLKFANGVISIEEIFGFLNMKASKRKEIFGLKTLTTFIVGEVFKHRDDSCVPQYHGDNFVTRFLKQALLKTITVPNSIEKLKEFVLKRNMRDGEIQTENLSSPMDENIFSIVLFCLIIKPELGKELFGCELKKDETVYIMHVKKDDSTVEAFYVFWDDGEWSLYVGDFDCVSQWREGDVFLFFATDKK